MNQIFCGIKLVKNKNRHRNKKVKHSQGRSTKDKAPVLGILQRDGKIFTTGCQECMLESPYIHHVTQNKNKHNYLFR